MPTHAEKRALPYTPGQLYALVADVEKYPQFLPWCVASRIRKRTGNVIEADLIIGFKMIRESFTSRVTLSPPNRIDVTYLNGPFQYLNNHWIFEPTADGGTCIDFYVDFEFRSRLLQTIMGALFGEAVRRMVAAFENRAHQLYGGTAGGPKLAAGPSPR
ncbi:MAG TPA: type II toxin-antitoxin system RatA family toxin [Alphaproteobacteria bacterium]|nr:type II toxin-antitoxin system RatA family toxin [Alphaproteobacteria bacterium]